MYACGISYLGTLAPFFICLLCLFSFEVLSAHVCKHPPPYTNLLIVGKFHLYYLHSSDFYKQWGF